jgi:hypothetical protein
MINKIHKRVSKLELTIGLLEEHLRIFGHLITPNPLKFIKNQINTYKRELQIRKDYQT